MSKLQLGIYGTKARRRERRNVNLVALKHNNWSKQIAIDQISKRQSFLENGAKSNGLL